MNPDMRARGLRVSVFVQLCGRCPRRIEPGDVIGRGPHGWCHVGCLPDALMSTSPRARRAARRHLARQESAAR